jgi:hypothetical protein
MTPEEERDPEDQDTTADRSHDSVGSLVAGLGNPWIGIETKQETKGGFEGKLSDHDFTGNWSIAIDGVYEGDVGRLSDTEVD